MKISPQEKAALLKEWGDKFSDMKAPSRFGKLELSGDKCIVASDWHVPLHSGHVANSLVRLARKKKIDTLIIPGDFFNFDGLSAFENKQEEAKLEIELNFAKETLYALLKTFDRIALSWGNHENRILRTLGYSSGLKRAFLMAGIDERLFDSHLIITDWDHLIWRKQWYVCHPKNYSVIPGRVAQDLASKFLMNIIAAHSHALSLSFDRSGKFVCIDSGGLFDPDRTEWLQRTTRNPKMVQGFLELDGDSPTLYSPQLGNLPA